MAVKARSYEVANIYLSVLGVIGWIQIVIGLFGVFAGGLGGTSQLELIITIGMKFLSAISVLSGLVSLALVQMARANVHSAEINWEMLQILRETSRSDLRSNSNLSQLSSGNGVKNEVPINMNAPGDLIRVYQGHQIVRERDGVSVGERKFANVIEAERWLDGG